MSKLVVSTAMVGVLCALGSQAVMAAPDWSKVPIRTIQVFHPGTTPIEWMSKKASHSGFSGMRKGESCVGCHEEKGGLNFTFRRLAGKELEPKAAPRTMSYPVSFQAAYDKDKIYIRLSFKPPVGAADKGDKANEVKAAVMFANAAVPKADLYGCWQTCHGDARTMPGADEKKTKYTAEGAYELMQWRSSKGANAVDGSVTTERKMEGGKADVKAEGIKSGDSYTVSFSRNNPGEGRKVPFGIAIHSDHASGRFHHVSLGYNLAIGVAGDADGDIVAIRQ